MHSCDDTLRFSGWRKSVGAEVAARPYQYSSASYVRLAQIRRISRKLRVAPSSLLCKRGARLHRESRPNEVRRRRSKGLERENRRKREKDGREREVERDEGEIVAVAVTLHRGILIRVGGRV